MCEVTYSYVSHDSFISVTCFIYMCDATHSYMWRDSCGKILRFWHACVQGCVSPWVTWLYHMPDMTDSYVWHDSFRPKPWLCRGGCEAVKVCDTTCLYVWRDWFICVTRFFQCDTTSLNVSVTVCLTHGTYLYVSHIQTTRPVYMCDVTYSYVSHDSFIRVMWRIHMCDVTHSYVWRDSFGQILRLSHACVWDCQGPWVVWLNHMCNMAHSYVKHDSSGQTRRFWCGCFWGCQDLWHDSFIHATWLVHIGLWHDSFTWYDLFICVTWLILTGHYSFILLIHTKSYAWHDMTHSHVWHDSFWDRIFTHMNQFGTRMNKPWRIFEWAMAHMWMSHVTQVINCALIEGCHTYEWVMAHTRMSHVIHMNEACHTRMSHVIHMNESCHTGDQLRAGQGLLHIRTRQGTNTNESWHTYQWAISRIRTSHVTQVINCALIEATDSYNGVGK